VIDTCCIGCNRRQIGFPEPMQSKWRNRTSMYGSRTTPLSSSLSPAITISDHLSRLFPTSQSHLNPISPIPPYMWHPTVVHPPPPRTPLCRRRYEDRRGLPGFVLGAPPLSHFPLSLSFVSLKNKIIHSNASALIRVNYFPWLVLE
jgi:hypothetical protein